MAEMSTLVTVIASTLKREILQAFASRGQSLVPIMAIMSNLMSMCMCV